MSTGEFLILRKNVPEAENRDKILYADKIPFGKKRE